MVKNKSWDAPEKPVSLCSHLAPVIAKRVEGGEAGQNTSTLLYLSATTESIWICQSSWPSLKNKVLAVLCFAVTDHRVLQSWKRGYEIQDMVMNVSEEGILMFDWEHLFADYKEQIIK